jgi:hypothetical protein
VYELQNLSAANRLCFTMKSYFLLLLVLFVQSEELNFKKMKIRQLKNFLKERNVDCDGCIEKKHYVATCERVKDQPPVPQVEEVEPKPEEPKPQEEHKVS